MSSGEWKDALKRIPRDERIVYLHLKEEIESLDRARAFGSEEEKRQLIALIEERISEVTGRLSSVEETLASIQSDMASFKDRMTDNATGPKTQVTGGSDAEASASKPGQPTRAAEKNVQHGPQPVTNPPRLGTHTKPIAEIKARFAKGDIQKAEFEKLARERFNYLENKPFSELSDSEFDERLHGFEGLKFL